MSLLLEKTEKLIKLIIYNINSFGGNYEYSKRLFDAYLKHYNVSRCTLLMPSNAEISGPYVLKILHSDISRYSNKIIKKFHFIYRSFVNPYRLYRYLKTQDLSIVLLNDYDQITAMFWVPLIRMLKKKHRFAVILHDPDRDNFFSLKFLSDSTMKSIMSLMDIAFYHGYLPNRSYYKGHFLKINVPHGIYDSVEMDECLFSNLNKLAEGNKIIGILGNIRPEKNYELVIDALAQLPKIKLLIAGNVANSSVSIDYYKQYAIKKGVHNQVIWVTEYLSHAGFNAAIKACDIILLYYKPSFTSQSGVLNAIAPFKKKLIISDSESSLKDCVSNFSLGEIVAGDNVDSLVKAISLLSPFDNSAWSTNWERYMKESSWDKHVSIAVEHYKKL